MVIQGPVVAEQRIRFKRLNSRIVTYDPNSSAKRRCRAALLSALGEMGVGAVPIFRTQAVRLSVVFRVNNMHKDVDNMLKFIFDVLQGVLYTDDRKVHHVTAEKVASVAEGTTIIATEYVV